MDELTLLRQRRELVTLSADLQRATLQRRLKGLQARPSRAVFGLLALAGTQPGVRRVAFAAAALAFRAWRRRRARP